MARTQLVTLILTMAAGSEALGLVWLSVGLKRMKRSFASFAKWGSASALDFLIACAIAAAYCAASWSPTVAEWAFRISALKGIALVAAIVAGVFEELFFRAFLMGLLQRRGYGAGIQICVSGVCFGVGHAAWGLGHLTAPAALLPVAWTLALGIALAALYIKSRRSVGPVILAHILIDAIIEPGLLLSAFG